MAEDDRSVVDKLKAQRGVLKKAYLDEKQRREAVDKELEKANARVAELLEKVDTLGLNGARLTKRCERLMANKSAKATESSWALFGGGSSQKDKEEVQVLRDELGVKIGENAKLHNEIFEMKSEFQKTVDVLEKRLTDVKLLYKNETELRVNCETELASERRRFSNELSLAQSQVMQKNAELETCLQNADSERRISNTNQASLENRLQKLQVHLKQQLPFDDKNNPVWSALDAPAFNFTDWEVKKACFAVVITVLGGMRTRLEVLLMPLARVFGLTTEECSELVAGLWLAIDDISSVLESLSVAHIAELSDEPSTWDCARASDKVGAGLHSVMDNLGRLLCLFIERAEDLSISEHVDQRVNIAGLGRLLHSMREVRALFTDGIVRINAFSSQSWYSKSWARPCAILDNIDAVTMGQFFLRMKRSLTGFSSALATVFSSNSRSESIVGTLGSLSNDLVTLSDSISTLPTPEKPIPEFEDPSYQKNVFYSPNDSDYLRLQGELRAKKYLLRLRSVPTPTPISYDVPLTSQDQKSKLNDELNQLKDSLSTLTKQYEQSQTLLAESKTRANDLDKSLKTRQGELGRLYVHKQMLERAVGENQERLAFLENEREPRGISSRTDSSDEGRFALAVWKRRDAVNAETCEQQRRAIKELEVILMEKQCEIWRLEKGFKEENMERVRIECAHRELVERYRDTRETLAMTSQNYDDVVFKLTDHLCQLTEQIAHHDARR